MALALEDPSPACQQPGLEVFQQRLRPRFLQQASGIGIELTRLLLNGANSGDPRERLAGDLALPVLLKLEELAPGVGHAARFRDAFGAQGFVARGMLCNTYLG